MGEVERLKALLEQRDKELRHILELSRGHNRNPRH